MFIIGKKEIKCPKCGSTATVDTSVVLTSYPPKYEIYCKSCGNVSYIMCDELNSYDDTDLSDMKRKATAYDQVRWERDIAVAQLNEIGIGLGESMDKIKDLIKRSEDDLK